MHFPGSIIGNRYQIIQRLGREEKGRTYLAKDLQATADAWCAVEQLSFNYDRQANWQIIQQHLLTEVAVLERLGDHPQIPQFYSHFVENKDFYLVREYIDGDNLEQEVEGRLFNEADTINLLQDCLRILDFIHKTNVIHRDLQPRHVIRRKQDRAYFLIDFSAVRELELTEINLKGELILNNFVGNWSYKAPEQQGGISYFSSDLYALGRTAVYALTGRSPQELEQTNLIWSELCQISSKLEAILGKMMSPTAEQRYASALEVLYDLRPLLKIKQVVGERYSITRYLGGKFGIETYLADNLRRPYQSPCLIKQIELSGANGDGKIELEQRFAEELSILERLGYHEQIPQLWDHFEENDEFYLVQEYIQGENLAQKIARQDLSTPQAIQILVSALSVLKFIHQNRIIHRNIKPSNLIIRDRDWQVILTDFGILTDIKAAPNRNSAQNQSQDRQNYYSPEQIAGRPTISSDLYAIGMSIIEALTNVKPATFERERTGKLLWTSKLDLDRRLIRIIDKLVQPDLGQRYDSAERVLRELQKVTAFNNSSQRLLRRADIKNLSASSPPPLPLATSEPGGSRLLGAKSASSSLRRRRLLQRLTKPVTVGQSQTDKLQPSRAKSLIRPRINKLPLVVGFLGILFLLGSIEFTFPTLRPIYYWYQGKKLLPEQPQTALNTFTKAIDLKPQSWRAWSGRGDALAALERYPQALTAYVEAAQLNPNNADNLQQQGIILDRLERYSEAIASYDRAIELEPNNGTLYNLKGRALYQLQQYQSALAMQDKALATDRLNAQFLSDRAQNLFKLGKYSDALAIFNRVQAIEPLN